MATSNFITKDGTGNIQSYWSPGQAMLTPLAFLLVYCVGLLIAYCLAWFSLRNRQGVVIALISVCIPGIISLAGYWPTINPFPATYDIKSVGSLGNSYGMSALAIISLVSGWACVIISTDVFCLQDRFRHFYDHIWYAAAILGGLFFVADTGTTRGTRELQDTTKHVQQASSYLLRQVKDYKKYCKAKTLEHTASCRWANDIQQSLADYSFYDDRLYWQLGPKTTADLYSIIAEAQNGTQETAIRRELESFNQRICPSAKNSFTISSDSCQRPFAEFCTGVSDGVYMIRTVAVANECIIPTLVRLRLIMEKQAATIEAAAYTKHERWFFYIVFAFFAGGKVANATAKLTKNRPGQAGLGDQKNVISIFINLWRISLKFFHLSRVLVYQLILQIKRIVQLSVSGLIELSEKIRARRHKKNVEESD